jgi:Ca-activated chloride channel family protein
VQVDYVLEYDILSMAREHRLYLLARIKAGPRPEDDERRPLNLSVVLDRSSSMVGDKLDFVKQAAQHLVQRLGANDHFSLVTYNENVEVNVPPTPVVHKDAINLTIGAMKAGGTTNLSGGWLQGATLVEQHAAVGQVNRVLLLTDGLANQGVTEPDRLAAMARQKREEGITTTTMGVGMDFNEDLLTRMASEGGGGFYFIDHADQAPAMFAEELSDLLSVVGQNLSITLSLRPTVRMVRQLNAYPADVDDQARVLTFRLGDLYADELKTLVLELTIPALKALGTVQVADLHFAYDELADDRVTHQTLDLPVMVNAVPDDAYQQPPSDEAVLKSALLLRAARAREEAIKRADAGDFEVASQVLSGAADELQSKGLDDPELQSQHDMLREEALDMELGQDRYDAFSRKASATKSYQGSVGENLGQTVALHLRLKSSRPALERSGPPPQVLLYKGERMDLAGIDSISIGRAPDNTIAIAQDRVSAHHCLIVCEGDDLILEDLNSTNGTFANGGRVATGGRFRLSAGDIVTVGTWLFMFRRGD